MSNQKGNEMTETTQINTSQDVALNLNTLDGFRNLQRAAALLSDSPLVPKEYQGKAGISSCAIALDLASRIKASPLMVMQNLYIVHGRPGWSSQFLIAAFNQSGRYTSIKFEFSGDPNGDDYGCRAYATEKSTGEKLGGPLVTIRIARAEGWLSKTGSKWKTMPEQMLRYRAAAWFVRTTAPEISMGLPQADELEDYTDAEIVPETPTLPDTRNVKAASRAVEWNLAQLEAFDTMMETLHVAFKDAGYGENYEAFAAPWRDRRGKGDAEPVIEELQSILEHYAGQTNDPAQD